jgi:protein O-GlcNAc transferase
VATRRPGPLVPSQAFETALSLHRQGRLPEAEDLYRGVLKAEPNHSGALHHLGVLKAQQGNPDEAIRLIRLAVERAPRSAEAHNDLGVALEVANRHAEAVPCYERALALRSDYPQASFNLGNALQALERHDEAISRFERALEVVPSHAEAHNNLGKSLFALGRHQQAIAQFERALASNPGYAEAEHNLANALHGLGHYPEALAHAERALLLKPNFAKAHGSAGNALRQLHRSAEAIRHFERAIALEPGYAEAHYNLGSLFKELGRREDAAKRYERALELKPDLAEARFGLCMIELAVLYRDEAEISERRLAYERRLTRLRDEVERGKVPGNLAAGLGSNLPFYLAYQGLDDRNLQSVYGGLACRIMADAFPPARIGARPTPGEPVRVGIVSGFFHQHSVWKIPIKGWLSQLDRRRFRVFGYYTGLGRGPEIAAAAALCDRFVQGPLPLARWRESILADAPHVLIYPEIGMDGASVQLAAQRLAPVQCNSLGHPVTSGFPTLDYYLSSELMEPPDGQQHYTERLVPLPNLSIYYEPVEASVIALARSEIGLREGATAFWCGQSLYKYLPQYDQIYPRIAREGGNCQFVFIEYARGSDITDLFRRRLDRVFKNFGRRADDHCVFLPRLDQDRFIAAIGRCDVFLDSIGWSGYNSTLESLAHDLPIVTMSGGLMRARHTVAILRRMGVADTVTESLDDYVSVAARLARDADWRKLISRRIAENKYRVYRDRACIVALEEFLDSVVRTGNPDRRGPA